MLGALFIAAIKCAQSLNDGADIDSNPEYIRGQAELICDMFGIDSDEKDTIIERILRGN